PEPRTAPQAFAAYGRIDIGRARDRCGAVEALKPLQRRDLFEPHLARPGIDRRGLVPGVYAEPRHGHEGAVGMLPRSAEESGQLVPRRGVVGAARDDDVIDK